MFGYFFEQRIFDAVHGKAGANICSRKATFTQPSDDLVRYARGYIGFCVGTLRHLIAVTQDPHTKRLIHSNRITRKSLHLFYITGNRLCVPQPCNSLGNANVVRLERVQGET